MGITKLTDIEAIHQAVLDVAKVFHKLCEKHHFTYYMVGGGLIGAIRHKGFIPWDDDLDFYVPRSQFTELVAMLKKELPDYYKITTCSDDDFFWGEMVKVERTDMQVKEAYGENYCIHGPFIDLFPMDYTNNSKRFFSRNWTIRKLLMIETIRRRGAKGIKGKTVYVFSSLFGKHFIKKIVKTIVSTNGDYCVNYWGAWGERECVPCDIIGKPTLYKFEDTYLYGVEKYDEFLTYVYGNYMKLPPVEKRRTHLVLDF